MLEKIRVVIGLTLIPVLSVFAGAVVSTDSALDANTHIPLGVFITAISVTAGIAYAGTKAWDSLMCRIKSIENTVGKLYCVKNGECLKDKEKDNEKQVS